MAWTFSQLTLPEFEREMAVTRKVLARVPEDKFDWKLHPKSNTIGWNANHLAEIPGWASNILMAPGVDLKPPGEPAYETPELRLLHQILAAFDKNVEDARKAIVDVPDSTLMDTWQYMESGHVVFEMPRVFAFRAWVMNHVVHHRAILTAYFRVNCVSVPAIYGDSADEAE